MLLHLIKKDFLLIKTNAIFLCFFALVFPFLIWFFTGIPSGITGFIFSSFYSTLILIPSLAFAEYISPKTAAYLCAAPYPRKYLALSKYLFFLILYLACFVLFLAETAFLPFLGDFSLETAAIVFFLLALFISVYFPLQYMFGYEKTKIILIIFIIAGAYLASWIIGANMKFSFAQVLHIPSLFITTGGFLLGILFLSLSAFFSVQIYEGLDLA